MALVIFAVHFLVLKQAEVAYPAAGGTKVCGSKFLYFFAEVAHLVEHPAVGGTKVGVTAVLIFFCGSSSFGRARPCQGRGGRFEPGLPLWSKADTFCYLLFFSKSVYPGGGTGRHAGLKIL